VVFGNHITSVVGPRSFFIKSFDTGKVYKRHLDHLVRTAFSPGGLTNNSLPLPDESLSSFAEPLPAPELPVPPASAVESTDVTSSSEIYQPSSLAAGAVPGHLESTHLDDRDTGSSRAAITNTTTPQLQPLRRSVRVCKPVDKLNL